MFYSHTFLAKKESLGMIWRAAHFQDKFKKSRIMSTNISYIVEEIMNPEKPFALRISGHLLLGVVLIYSKQVNYLYDWCEEKRVTNNRVVTTVSVNLPGDATHAQFHSVTLPEKFDLDAVQLDDNNMDWSEDSHLKSWDEITLADQIPTGNDPYIIISFEDHELRASLTMEDTSGTGPMPMDEEDRPDIELDASAAGFKSPPPNINLRADGNRTAQSSPSIEIMREAHFDFNNSPILPDRAAPDKFLEDRINKDNEMHTTVREEVVLPDAHFSSSHHHEELPHSFGHLDSHIHFEHRSPEMEIQSTPEMAIQPTPPVAKPGVKRTRRQHYDRTTVLSNEYLKNNLNDTSDICRERGNCPLTSLAIWKENNRKKSRKEDDLFVEPHITGASADLLSAYEEDPTKDYLVHTQETHVGQPSLSRHDDNIEIEVLRNDECPSPERYVPPFSTLVPSSSRIDHFSPLKSHMTLQSDRLERTEDGTLPRSDIGASVNLDSEIRTPDAFYENDMHIDNTGLSDIPELVPSAGELGFLEQEDSPADSRGTPEIASLQEKSKIPPLSSRAKAVAEYLKRQSATPIPCNTEESSEELSLNKILEDKPRKICARMFYETLVLKKFGLIDVHQEKPYDDVVIKVVTSKPKNSGVEDAHSKEQSR